MQAGGDAAACGRWPHPFLKRCSRSHGKAAGKPQTPSRRATRRSPARKEEAADGGRGRPRAPACAECGDADSWCAQCTARGVRQSRARRRRANRAVRRWLPSRLLRRKVEYAPARFHSSCRRKWALAMGEDGGYRRTAPGIATHQVTNLDRTCREMRLAECLHFRIWNGMRISSQFIDSRWELFCGHVQTAVI